MRIVSIVSSPGQERSLPKEREREVFLFFSTSSRSNSSALHSSSSCSNKTVRVAFLVVSSSSFFFLHDSRAPAPLRSGVEERRRERQASARARERGCTCGEFGRRIPVARGGSLLGAIALSPSRLLLAACAFFLLCAVASVSLANHSQSLAWFLRREATSQEEKERAASEFFLWRSIERKVSPAESNNPETSNCF